MCLPPLATKLLNVTIYQVGWFCCVLGAAWGFPIAGALSALLLAGLHLLLAASWKNEALLMVAACLLGIVVDSLQQALDQDLLAGSGQLLQAMATKPGQRCRFASPGLCFLPLDSSLNFSCKVCQTQVFPCSDNIYAYYRLTVD